MKLYKFRSTSVATVACAIFAFSLPALAQNEAADHVTRATKTLSDFEKDPQMTWFQQNIGRAHGVLIVPEVVRAGFIFGGSGGRGVLVVRDPKTGRVSNPEFYTLATASIGFQAGVDVSEVVMLVMTDKALNSLLSNSFKLGGDASIAAGPVGAGAKSNVTADFISFSRSKGLYGGLNLDGTSITVNNDWAQTYYGKPVLAPDILIRFAVSNEQSAPLRETLAKAAMRK